MTHNEDIDRMHHQAMGMGDDDSEEIDVIEATVQRLRDAGIIDDEWSPLDYDEALHAPVADPYQSQNIPAGK